MADDLNLNQPNIKAALAKALPAQRGGHVLAMGEYHSTTDHLKALNASWKALSDPAGNNVGTLGLERGYYTNVLFWAMEDGNLPVPKGQESAYLRQRMMEYSNPAFRHNTQAKFDLINTALQKGSQVVAYDMRNQFSSLKDDYAEEIKVIRTYFPPDEGMRLTLRTDAAALQTWLAQFPGERRNWEMAWMLNEIDMLVESHPEYGDRLTRMEAIAAYARTRGLKEDGQSAALLDSEANRAKNTIVVAGHYHLAGVENPASANQGLFAAHLEHNGLNVTSALVASGGELEKVYIPYNSPPKDIAASASTPPCKAKAPMQLWVVDKDVVANVSLPGAPGFYLDGNAHESALRNAVALSHTLVNAGTKLTCDQPELPGTAQRVGEEIRRGQGYSP